ncbi:DUF2117 domain-containing protein [Methanolobus sp. ZRKC3]|uniref:DUF2117 family protein n=1 Tax=Methanolobus sp. ZRKC3 TaxID=3125786 RepID=UPI003255D095
MEIGIVIHGPHIVDTGMALKIIEILARYGNCTARMAGTIGKTAVLDAHMENTIDIKASMKPSECIEDFFKTKDVVFLLNHGKSIYNGYYFANIVVSKLSNRNCKPLIQVERPSSSDGEIIPWNKGSIPLAQDISRVLELPLSDVPDTVTPIRIEDHGHRIIRKVYGVHPGEKILVNGIIVGFSNSEDIQIVTEDGFITDIKGAEIKQHGLEKLHAYEDRIPIDITKCWVKSGPLRSNDFSVRSNSGHQPEIKPFTENSKPALDMDSSQQIRVAIIDHEAERTFEIIEDAQVVVTVGDDTTEIAGDILYRLNIPIIGITDGDRDGFSHRTHIYPGSMVFRVMSGHDDIVGRKIKEELFLDQKIASFNSLEDIMNEIQLLVKEFIETVTHY